MIKFSQLLEDFLSIGRLSPEELIKGQRLTTDDTFEEVDGRTFHNVIVKIRDNDIARGDKSKGLDTLTVYNVSDYKKMRCFLGKNNSSGYALKKTELVSVFSSQNSSGTSIVQDAIRNGAKHLDCFATIDKDGEVSGALFSLYSRNGFVIDKSMNSGTPGEAYSIQKGISRYVNDDGEVEPNNPNVVVFMKLK
jgi:hypothetical protein